MHIFEEWFFVALIIFSIGVYLYLIHVLYCKTPSNKKDLYKIALFSIDLV